MKEVLYARGKCLIIQIEVRKGRYIRFLSGHDELAVCEDKCCLFVAKKEKNKFDKEKPFVYEQRKNK